MDDEPPVDGQAQRRTGADDAEHQNLNRRRRYAALREDRGKQKGGGKDGNRRPYAKMSGRNNMVPDIGEHLVTEKGRA